MFRKRKADMSLDLIFIVAMLFILAVGWIITGWAFTEINDDLVSDFDLSSEAKESLADTHDGFNSDMDGLIAFVFFGGAIFVIVSAWFLDSHPLFFVLGLIVLGLGILVVVTLANSFEEIVTDIDFVSTANEFEMTLFIFQNMVELVVGVAFFSALALYGKNRFGGF